MKVIKTKKALLLEKLTDALELCTDVHQVEYDVYTLEAGNSIEKAIQLIEATLPEATN